MLVTAEEIHFMDRPSVTFDKWGTIGQDSFARQIDWSGSPVLVDVHGPPSGPGQGLYTPYIEADLNNPIFAEIVLEGFRSSDEFASKYIQFEANYGSDFGRDIVNALRQDGNLTSESFSFEVDGKNMFNISTHEHRVETFKTILIAASIKVTSATLVAEGTDTIPISADPYIARLIGLRTSDLAYVGGTSRQAPYIGLALAKSVIPDEALKQLNVTEILEYREKAKESYAAWIADVNRSAAEIGKIDGNISQDEIARIIAADYTPKLIDYKNEMSAIRDDIFADVMKKVVKWEVPTLSLAYISNVDIAGALMVFASAITPAVADIVDYFKDKRDIERRNAMSFLIKLSKDE